MATLELLKKALKRTVETTDPLRGPLSDEQYSAGRDILLQGLGWMAYQQFIVPQLSQLICRFSASGRRLSVLEIGPGPKSVLGYLPLHLRQVFKEYTAFEPNALFAAKLEVWLSSSSEMALPHLERAPDLHPVPFVPQQHTGSNIDGNLKNHGQKYDIVLFCHSMYGMNPKKDFLNEALEMLAEQSPAASVIVFHRDGALQLDDLVCQQTVSFPDATVSVVDNDNVLNDFTAFITGFTTQDLKARWRQTCRALGRRDSLYPNHILFTSPITMKVFNKHAKSLSKLFKQMSLKTRDYPVKNLFAQLRHPASVVQPKHIWQVQRCVKWALHHGLSLAVLGGGHSSHCIQSSVVTIDMGAFNELHILTSREDSGYAALVIAGAGCKIGDIVRETAASGIVVPLGARPSVGAGMWLQGGIGHLSRLYGLSCDSIVGAVIVSASSGEIICIGHVPSQHCPSSAIRPQNEADLLWAIRGAGTNFGIVVSIIFKSYPAPSYSVQNWIVPLNDDLKLRMKQFDEEVASTLPRNCSADAYLYWDNSRLCLGVTVIEAHTANTLPTTIMPMPESVISGSGNGVMTVDGIGLFETEMYMTGMHGGHGGGKTSSFKRCLFLKGIGRAAIADALMAVIQSRPSPLCYTHLLHVGGAVGDTAADATAFGCRDWDFACVITGVWIRDDSQTGVVQSVIRWVYSATQILLPLCSGVYGADLGPDPRDVTLAAKAFGPNLSRLRRVKRMYDPQNLLPYACPFPTIPTKQRLIILVTGESCAGKDYSADVWAAELAKFSGRDLAVRVASISDNIKQEYAMATQADLTRLLWDRAYKEQHRPALTEYFRRQVSQRPDLPQEQFLNVVHNAVGVDVLLITGMRDEAPVATLSRLVLGSRLIEVRVQAGAKIRRPHQQRQDGKQDHKGKEDQHSPTLVFHNESIGDEAAIEFASRWLIPFVDKDIEQLASMVHITPEFPSSSLEFHHVLGIAQHPLGLPLCTRLLRTHFSGDWTKVNAVASCEVGGFIYASALAVLVDVPLVLIREAGKLPPPTISTTKTSSHISSSPFNNKKKQQIEMQCDVVTKDTSVVVVDDVLSSGETLCAVLQLLRDAGVGVEETRVLIVAEFPVHRGRELLRQRGFGKVQVQSLLVFASA